MCPLLWSHPFNAVKVLIAQDEHSERWRGTPASNLSLSHHLILLVEKTTCRRNWDLTAEQLQKDSQIIKVQQKEKEDIVLHFS